MTELRGRARLAAVLIALASCSGTSDLERRANAIAQQRQPELDALVARIAGLKRRLRGNLPGWEAMLRVAELANDEIGLPPFTQAEPSGPAWQPSPASLLGIAPYVRQRAGQLARQGSGAELAYLVEDERRRYDDGIASVDRRLRNVESWLAAREAH